MEKQVRQANPSFARNPSLNHDCNTLQIAHGDETLRRANFSSPSKPACLFFIGLIVLQIAQSSAVPDPGVSSNTSATQLRTHVWCRLFRRRFGVFTLSLTPPREAP